ncbi:MAG: hypothetical protein FWD73_00870 [Polyangiaceae bacterium]|nr:hypothetical protein [Polyangiaceae bacterium]
MIIDVALPLLPTRHRFRRYAKERGEIFRPHSNDVPNEAERVAVNIVSAYERGRDIELHPLDGVDWEVDLATSFARNGIDDSSDALPPDADFVILYRCFQRFRSAIRARFHGPPPQNSVMTTTPSRPSAASSWTAWPSPTTLDSALFLEGYHEEHL